MGYDNLLVKAGDFGLYQKLLSGIFVFYTTFLCGLNYYTQVMQRSIKVPISTKLHTGVHLHNPGPPLFRRRDRL